ncbi:MAG: hypothetical protein ACXAC7_04175 [Candidatus Hodarchaeales archaeon]|jgi:rRNA maturation protein Rpf1
MNFLLSSSYKPPRRVRTFLNELQSIIPNSKRVNRGRMNLQQLFGVAEKLQCERVLLIFNRKGNPDRIVGYEYISGQFYWRFSWNLSQVKLKFELNIKKIQVHPKKWILSFDGVQQEVEIHLREFFGPILTFDDNDTHDALIINFSHISPGFKFQAIHSSGKIVPPAFFIKEILLLND